ncbi:MAG TPA: GyrI-like domain-containing protein [Planctomycetota bacterium]|nr:GyrI-like domain-containing protein [Planctomycetota bacterium]
MNPFDPCPSSLPLACAAAMLLTVFAARAQEPGAPAAADPELKALLERIDAARGKPAQQPLSLATEGTFEVTFEGAASTEPVAKGTFHDLFLGTGQARQENDMGAYGSSERGITPDLAWELDPMLGAKVYEGVHAAAVRRYFAVLRGASPRELYEKIERAGTKDLDGRAHVVLRMTPAEGKADTWYIDAEHATPDRIDMLLPAPESVDPTGVDAIDARLTFAEWRQQGGMNFPHRRTLEMGPACVSFMYTKVQFGAELAQKQFEPPAAITKLRVKASQPAVDAGGKPIYQVVERQAQPVASIRVKCKPSEISATLAVVLPEVMAHLNATGAKMAGAPFSRYHTMGTDEIDLEAGIPVQKPIEEKGRVKNSELPAGKVATVWHIGPYDKLGSAHEALAAFAASKHLAVNGGPWEVYWTDPGMVPDSAKWRTQLFLPVK